MDNEYRLGRAGLGSTALKVHAQRGCAEKCLLGFNRNSIGVRIARAKMGVDKVMSTGDFPHLESDWPNSRVADFSLAREVYPR